ncbi:MAG TPA: SGNH/GDSL hydrolase family protein [Burkholderiaceae bacterium]|nr:SGNH/GDSL hydrolase family protein [Burkholderiaceae bacterium]
MSRPRPKWRSPRFLLKVLLANALVFAVVFALGEFAVRAWREGGLVAGLQSFAWPNDRPHGAGTGDWFRADAELGYTLDPGRPEVSSLRIRHGELGPKEKGAFRLLLIGDSVTWPADGFAALLAARLCAERPQVETINAAVPGYTAHQERLHLARLLAPVAPDVVVVQYCCNDNHAFLHQLVGGGLLLTQAARTALLPPGDGPWARFQRWSYLAFELRRRLAGPPAAAGPFPWRDDAAFEPAWRDDSWPMLLAEYDAMLALGNGAGARLLVLAMPHEAQLADAALAADAAYTCMPQSRLGAWCTAHAVPFVDLHPAFVRHRDEHLFVRGDPVHLSAAGHALVAAELHEALVAAHLLP